ncbi:MAG TPA: methionine biosynthesis protein MetW [Bryobacteraceae bacterium]|jgi:methionine biosynthesis protein MetW|nr:methionine biosynthesis protein MetW [Bryobacteraceae bacterium]
MGHAAAAIARQQPVTLTERPDFHVIGEIVEPGSRVLDLGCGEGELLAWLVEHKRVLARGVEISPAQVRRAIGRGVSVFQGDIDEGLVDYPDKAFDYVVLSQTLQETRSPLQVLREMLRVGRRAIISFPNFGHWSVRIAMLRNGQAPKTKLFPHNWYNSPNIHFLSINDFEDLCREHQFPIERRYFLAGARRVGAFPNLVAQTAVFLLG